MLKIPTVLAAFSALMMLLLPLFAHAAVINLLRDGFESYTLAPVTPHVIRFHPESFWYEDISLAPKATNSDAVVNTIYRDVVDNWNGISSFNTSEYNASFYDITDVPTTTHTLLFDDCQNKNWTDPNLFTTGKRHFVNVPIPAGIMPSPGSDGMIGIYDRNRDQLWEFWKFKDKGDGTYQACWGGRMDNVSQSEGVYQKNYGTAASGLSISGGMISLEDIRQGSINHAIYLVGINIRRGVSWPANRHDGWTNNPDHPTEGQRFRVRADVDCGALNLHRIAEFTCVAAQKYGFVMADKGGAVGIAPESPIRFGAPGSADDPWVKILNGTPTYSVFKNFPWDKLEALPLDYGKP